MCLEQQVLMVPNQSLGLDSFSARVLQLVRLVLLKGTCCSNLALSAGKPDSSWVFLKSSLQFSSSLLKLTIPSKWHYRLSFSPAPLPG